MEIRYYLGVILEAIRDSELKLQYIVTAVELPTGAIEIAVNNSGLEAKIEYMLSAYDAEMHLKSNPQIIMKNVMCV